MRGQLTAEFKLLANDVLKTHGETFSKSNQEQIDGLLNPMRHRLTEFQDVLRLANEQTIRERAALGEQIKSLSDASGRMSTETLNLTRALKGEAQAQGAWGEMILASILERSGLIKGEQYFTQESHTGEEGGRLRPDVIVRLPGDLQVIVDSKVSLVAFEAHVAAETDEDRASALNRHVASIRGHIRGLSGKKYQDLGSNDFVVMFIPIEGALALALQRDPDITSHAVANNVAIATPTTLMIALRTVANVWQVENRNRNAEEIAKRAGLLYDKFVGFTEDMLALRKRLDEAAKSHDAAMGKLSTGSGNLVRQAVLLRELGAKAGPKQIAAALMDDTAAATATE
jgi:DNA recombination protein RmuC